MSSYPHQNNDHKKLHIEVFFISLGTKSPSFARMYIQINHV